MFLFICIWVKWSSTLPPTKGQTCFHGSWLYVSTDCLIWEIVLRCRLHNGQHAEDSIVCYACQPSRLLEHDRFIYLRHYLSSKPIGLCSFHHKHDVPYNCCTCEANDTADVQGNNAQAYIENRLFMVRVDTERRYMNVQAWFNIHVHSTLLDSITIESA